MVIRTTEQWQALFKQHRAGGQTIAQFCRENHLCPKYFAKRRKELGWQRGESAKPKLVKLVKPTSDPSSPSLTLQLGRATLSMGALPLSTNRMTPTTGWTRPLPGQHKPTTKAPREPKGVVP